MRGKRGRAPDECLFELGLHKPGPKNVQIAMEVPVEGGCNNDNQSARSSSPLGSAPIFRTLIFSLTKLHDNTKEKHHLVVFTLDSPIARVTTISKSRRRVSLTCHHPRLFFEKRGTCHGISFTTRWLTRAVA